MEYIYKILNTINGKFYIGRTIHPNVRKRQHFNMLRKNIHHCIKLQNAYNKYNKEDFIFIIIENVEYNSVSLASKALNVCPATIIYRIKSNNIKFKNYFYKINA